MASHAPCRAAGADRQARRAPHAPGRSAGNRLHGSSGSQPCRRTPALQAMNLPAAPAAVGPPHHVVPRQGCGGGWGRDACFQCVPYQLLTPLWSSATEYACMHVCTHRVMGLCGCGLGNVDRLGVLCFAVHGAHARPDILLPQRACLDQHAAGRRCSHVRFMTIEGCAAFKLRGSENLPHGRSRTEVLGVLICRDDAFGTTSTCASAGGFTPSIPSVCTCPLYTLLCS